MSEPTIDDLVERYKQWMIGANQDPGPLLPRPRWTEDPTEKYDLKNNQTDKFLQWEEQNFGINLGWTDDASPATALRVRRWFFARQGDDSSPIRYGEEIALAYGTKQSFLKWEKRDVGIDLAWSQPPVFEWKILGGNPGDAVNTQEWLALYNKREEDCLLHFDRTAGANIGWPSSKTWGDQIPGRVWSWGKKQALSKLGL
jgi:hypothetical protein